MKYLKHFNSINESQESDLAKKFKPENYVLIGTNKSHWGWDYDNINVYAFIYMNPDDGNLILKIVKSLIKTGIAPGITTSEIDEKRIGNIGVTDEKPNRELIKNMLKKYGHERSRAATPFNSNEWIILNTNEKVPLMQLFKDRRVLRLAKIGKLLNDEETVETGEVIETPQTHNNEKPQRDPNRTKKLAYLHKQMWKLSDTEIDELIKKLS